MSDVFVLEQRQVSDWTAEEESEVLGYFTSQEAAIRWLRKSRKVWGDTAPLIPVQHPSGCTLAGGRYRVTRWPMDPEPITEEQWEKRVAGTAMAAGSSGDAEAVRRAADSLYLASARYDGFVLSHGVFKIREDHSLLARQHVLHGDMHEAIRQYREAVGRGEGEA